jgi:DNA polymerase IV
MPALCRDCCAVLLDTASVCPQCHSGRIVAHAELFRLTIAHVDCDAF